MKKAVIFDLDLTLVDSTSSEPARHIRDWKTVYSLIPQYRLYDGLNEVFSYIRNNYIKVAIVSTAPSIYVQRVVNQFNIPTDFIVGYHDAKPIKPNPVPMIKALNLLDIRPADTISFGDRAIDILAAKRAQIESIACLWGTKEKSTLLDSPYDALIDEPREIITLLSRN